MSEYPYNTPTPQPAYNDYAYGAPPPLIPRLPTFVKGWAIADLVFCCIRGVLTPMSFIGLVAMDSSNPMYPTVIFEALTNLGLAAFGIPANILLLKQKPLGVTLGWITVGVALVSILVGCWQGSIQFSMNEGPEEMRGGMLVGLVFAIVARLVLNGFYVAALVKAKAWFQQQEQGPAEAGGYATEYSGYE